MKANATEVDGTMIMPVTEDARQMCFAQGKSCVYASDDDRFIISETPAGVVDRHELQTGQVTRSWPDGTEETFPANSPRHREYPAWPRPIAAPRAKAPETAHAQS